MTTQSATFVERYRRDGFACPLHALTSQEAAAFRAGGSLGSRRQQDITYWGLEQEGEIVTAWVVLSPSDVSSGCMAVVPGSHQRDVLPHRETDNHNNMLSRGQELAIDVTSVTTVDLELLPGQMSLHHVKMFHGSHANRSDDRLIGFAVRYLPPHLRQAVSTRDSATLIRGEDRFGNFELEPAPAADLDPDAVALHKELGKRRAKILMRDIGQEE